MKRGYRTRALAAGLLMAVIPLAAQAGIQTTTCRPGPQPGQMVYTFFACTPNTHADELRVSLHAMEIAQGETIIGCSVPVGSGMTCSFTPMVATFLFPMIGPFECVPNLPGDSGKFSVTIASGDGVSLVDEQWFLGGTQVAGFISVITCPPISVEDTSWGRIKATYR
jgi:hypothetical protein